MNIKIHPHAAQRAIERGAIASEIIDTIESGEQFPAKYDRIGFRKNFLFDAAWNQKHYTTKQLEAYCVIENNEYIVLTVLVKYF